MLNLCSIFAVAVAEHRVPIDELVGTACVAHVGRLHYFGAWRV